MYKEVTWYVDFMILFDGVKESIFVVVWSASSGMGYDNLEAIPITVLTRALSSLLIATPYLGVPSAMFFTHRVAATRYVDIVFQSTFLAISLSSDRAILYSHRPRRPDTLLAASSVLPETRSQ